MSFIIALLFIVVFPLYFVWSILSAIFKAVRDAEEKEVAIRLYHNLVAIRKAEEQKSCDNQYRKRSLQEIREAMEEWEEKYKKR